MPYAWYSINLSNCSAFFLFLTLSRQFYTKRKAADNFPRNLSPSELKKRFYAKNIKGFSGLVDGKKDGKWDQLLHVSNCSVAYLLVAVFACNSFITTDVGEYSF
jgi:hypothetical protein